MSGSLALSDYPGDLVRLSCGAIPKADSGWSLLDT
jgi:hypothetical protein